MNIKVAPQNGKIILSETVEFGVKGPKNQIVTDPNHMFFEAERKANFLTGSEVIKEAIKRAGKASAKKAIAIRALAEALPARLIPMADYRPKYPKIDAEVEINPNHPNLTIWHNKIDVCIFVGVHCHQANLALKIIRGGTNCYTIALCAQAGHEDACLSFRDINPDKINRFTETVKKLKKEGVESQANPFKQFKMSPAGRIEGAH